jgi:hypothetical protein
MIDISNWDYFYKLDYRGGHQVPTNMLYTPKVNQEKNIMCMIWDETEPYQKENTKITKELVDFFFARELEFLSKFQKFSWAPKVIDIDIPNKQVFIEFNKETLNHIFADKTRDINIECPDWQDQIFKILQDIVDSGFYKMALYPHCFFIDENKKFKTFDFYSCSEQSQRYLEISKIAGMIGQQSVERFSSATVDGYLDFDIFFKNTLKTHLSGQWPINPFPEFYERLFND